MAEIIEPPERRLNGYISDTSERADIRTGSPLPLGIQEVGGGVNFAIFSRHATRVRIELFDHPEDAAPARVIDLDSARNRTGDVWHVWVKGIPPGQLYGNDLQPGRSRGCELPIHRCAAACIRDAEEAAGSGGLQGTGGNQRCRKHVSRVFASYMVVMSPSGTGKKRCPPK